MLRSLKTIGRPEASTIPDDCTEFLKGLPGPSWIECPGLRPGRARVVVTLLHGNEASGVRAVHSWLRSGARPAVDTALVVGSVDTALTDPAYSNRTLPGQRDANRCFGKPQSCSVGRAAQAIIAKIERLAPQALIDVHNNTGHNPPYGVGVGASEGQLNLTRFFASRYMNSDLNLGALMELKFLADAVVTIECGKAGEEAADQIASVGLASFLGCAHLNLDAACPNVQVLSQPIRVVVHPDVPLSFDSQARSGNGLTLREDVEQHNFESVEAGTALGWYQGRRLPVAALNARGEDIADMLFELRRGRLTTRCPMVPIMTTVDERIAREDCLFYAMLHGVGSPSR